MYPLYGYLYIYVSTDSCVSIHLSIHIYNYVSEYNSLLLRVKREQGIWLVKLQQARYLVFLFLCILEYIYIYVYVSICVRLAMHISMHISNYVSEFQRVKREREMWLVKLKQVRHICVSFRFYLYIYVCIFLYMYPYRIYVHQSIYLCRLNPGKSLPIHIYIFLYLYMYLSVSRSVYLSVYVSIYITT